ncbi:uncharacterized protein C8orf76 homolog isoform X2 [Corvus hawaiiensis]|uniref:uncharacterized protein C8orf76 homolog isoform X2 n=1 Tax=Corvus hawaiiensis TaxID=134902 RepID=UPI0020195F8B|nr:uncharacterized protein C8orf76 homolog isoform X2 [Corvus hawaiiensis]
MLTEHLHNYAVNLSRRGALVQLLTGRSPSTSLWVNGARSPPPARSGAGGGARGPAGAAAAMEPALGPEFEDSLFAPSRERRSGGGDGAPCGARHCEPRKALCEYSDCLLLLPASNIAMRRDVQEGQARCLSRLGRHKEALDIAEKMRNSATNTDHLTTVLNLQFSIYQGLENVEKKIMCLQQLICLHPFSPWFWKLLAEAYMSLLQNLSPLVIPEANVNQSEEVCVRNSSFRTSPGRENNLQPHRSDGQKEGPWFNLIAETKWENAVICSSSQVVREFLCTSGELERTDKEERADSKSWKQNMSKKVGIKACASFIRARLLLQLTQSQQSSFVLENNRKSQKEIDDKVAQLGFDENSLQLMTKAMGQDLIPEKLKEEFQGEVKCIGSSALSSLVTASVTEFEIKWFGNLQDDLCHFGTQRYSDIYLPPSVM